MENNQQSLPRILIYQDDDCSVMVDYLTFYGFSIISSTEQDIEAKIQSEEYDICILSHYKNPIPGDLRLLKLLRKLNDKTPVLFVSDQHRYDYVIEAFNAGADDYIIRPYNLEELVCRIKAILKRCGIKTRGVETIYKIGDYTFNTETDLLTNGTTEIKLTNKESKTLALLCAYKNEMLPKKILMNNIWENDNYFNKRSLDVHMCHLRNYLKLDSRISIETKRGLGYSLVIVEE